MDNTDWKEKIVQLRKRDRLRRANAIHLHCVDCVGYELYAVTKCTCYIALYGNGEQAHIRRL